MFVLVYKPDEGAESGYQIGKATAPCTNSMGVCQCKLFLGPWGQHLPRRRAETLLFRLQHAGKDFEILAELGGRNSHILPRGCHNNLSLLFEKRFDMANQRQALRGSSVRSVSATAAISSW